MMNKEMVLAVVAKLPAEFTLDEMIEPLIILEKIRNGKEVVQGSRFISLAELKELAASWPNLQLPDLQ